MRIFIGSSSEQKTIASRIALALKKDNHEVLAWWDKDVFRAGDYTLDRLIELSKVCQGAVFVFGSDDEVFLGKIYRKKTSEQRN